MTEREKHSEVRSKAHRLSDYTIRDIAGTVVSSCGKQVGQVWVHGSQNPNGQKDPKVDSDLDILVIVPNIPKTPDGWDIVYQDKTEYGFCHRKIESVQISGIQVEVHWTTRYRSSMIAATPIDPIE
jgi:predicted nucleotidyltransferase